MYKDSYNSLTHSGIDSHIFAGCTANYELSSATVLHFDLVATSTFSHPPHHLYM